MASNQGQQESKGSELKVFLAILFVGGCVLVIEGVKTINPVTLITGFMFMISAVIGLSPRGWGGGS